MAGIDNYVSTELIFLTQSKTYINSYLLIKSIGLICSFTCQYLYFSPQLSKRISYIDQFWKRNREKGITNIPIVLSIPCKARALGGA